MKATKTFRFEGKETGIEIEEFTSWAEAVKRLGSEDKALRILNSGWVQRQRMLLHSRLMTIQGRSRRGRKAPKPVLSKAELKLKKDLEDKVTRAIEILVKSDGE